MISRDPTLWYLTVEVDKGSDDGVRVNDPVLGDGALVGKVTTVAPTVSIVTLITDHYSAVTAQVQDQYGDTGVLIPAVGNPNQLLLQYLPRHAPIQVGQQVVTAGFKSGPLDSLFPAGIPIGQVSGANQNTLINNGQVQVTPAADLRHLTGGADPDRPARRLGPRAGAVNESFKLPLRLVALGFVTVVLQEAAISQISVFGVSADLTPLVVMSVGLLTGSMFGAITGFGIGLLVDMVLVQTLGVTSLLYIAIGYWSGRLRELRDPAHGLVPLALGAAATAFAGIGMAVIQFLLGVDAPVSLLLLQQIFISILVNTLIALPVYALVRRIVEPALPQDPRRRRRRAYTTGGLSPLQRPSERLGPIPRYDQMIQLPEDRRPPLTPQLALRVAVLGSFALAMFAIIFFRLWFLQVLSGDKYVQAASVNRVRDIGIPAPGARSSTARANILVDSKPAIAVQISPPDLPHSAAARRHLYRRLAGVLSVTTTPKRCQVPGKGVKRLAPIPCAVAQQVALLPYANVTLKTDVPNATCCSTSPSARRSSRGSRSSRSGCAATRCTTSPPSCSEPSGRSPRRRSSSRATGASRGRRSSGSRARVVLRQVSPRRGRSATRSRSTRSGSFRGYLSPGQADGRPHAQAVAGPGAAEGRTAGARPGDRQQPAGHRRSVRRAEPDERRGLRDGLLSDLRPEHLHQTGPGVGLSAAQQRLERLPAVQPRDPELVPHRLHVQGHHLDRGAAERRLDPWRHL